MVMGDVHAGVDPAAVLPEAVRVAGQLTAVESGQVEIVRGLPRVAVRFDASDDVEAAGVGRAVVARTDELVVVESSRVQRRLRNRWVGLGRGAAGRGSRSLWMN
jgi:hypothetical protein